MADEAQSDRGPFLAKAYRKHGASTDYRKYGADVSPPPNDACRGCSIEKV